MKKNKDILITKLDEGNGLVDLKVYDNIIQEIISDTSKFEKLNKDPTLRREASLQCFLRKLKQNFFNEIEYDKLFLLVSMVILKSTNFPLLIHFLNFV